MLYRQILAEGGSAIDAMIAMSLSLGVTRIVSSGIGGGGLLNYYKRYIITLFKHWQLVLSLLAYHRDER